MLWRKDLQRFYALTIRNPLWRQGLRRELSSAVKAEVVIHPVVILVNPVILVCAETSGSHRGIEVAVHILAGQRADVILAVIEAVGTRLTAAAIIIAQRDFAAVIAIADVSVAHRHFLKSK